MSDLKKEDFQVFDNNKLRADLRIQDRAARTGGIGVEIAIASGEQPPAPADAAAATGGAARSAQWSFSSTTCT